MSVTTTGMRHITAANLAEVTGPSQASSQEAFEGIARHAEAASLYAGAAWWPSGSDDSDCSP